MVIDCTLVVRFVLLSFYFFLYLYGYHRDLHSFPTRRSSDLVSVTEKLMDELAQCYNVLPQLDINNTIDHRPEGDEKWFLENEKTVTQFCRKLAAERPLKTIFRPLRGGGL